MKCYTEIDMMSINKYLPLIRNEFFVISPRIKSTGSVLNAKQPTSSKNIIERNFSVTVSGWWTRARRKFLDFFLGLVLVTCVNVVFFYNVTKRRDRIGMLFRELLLESRQYFYCVFYGLFFSFFEIHIQLLFSFKYKNKRFK